jgi:TonB family protein
LKHLTLISTISLFLIISRGNYIYAQVNSSQKQNHLNNPDNAKHDTIQKDTLFFEIEPKDRNAWIEFDTPPEFPGGDQALIEYAIKNTYYPQSAIRDSIEGRVIIRFAIDKDGSTCDTAVLRGIRPDLNKECMNVVMGMPKWKPGSAVFRAKKGLYIATAKWWYSIPFTFSLTNDSTKKGIIIKPSKYQ